MAFKVEITYKGTENFILDAHSMDEAIEMAVDKFEDKNPGMFVTDTYAETLTTQDLRELKHAHEL